MSRSFEPETYLVLARHWCDKGDHRQAAARFLLAGEAYEKAGKYLDAAKCYAEAEVELRWVRPSAPVNISALVD